VDVEGIVKEQNVDVEGTVGEQEVEEWAKEDIVAMLDLNCQSSVGPWNMTNSLYHLFAQFLVHLFDSKMLCSFIPESLAWLLQPRSLMTRVSQCFLNICCTFVDVA